MIFKTGIGYDVHKLVAGRNLVLGGIRIPHHAGLEGHSDADVVLHAVCDAMLGASGLGDIGEHFSDRDMQYKDISSLILLERVYKLVKGLGYRIGNLDVVILAQEPRLSSYKNEMINCISHALEVSEDAVNIKATTGEGLGFIGKCEGIACYATVLLNKDSK